MYRIGVVDYGHLGALGPWDHGVDMDMHSTMWGGQVWCRSLLGCGHMGDPSWVHQSSHAAPL